MYNSFIIIVTYNAMNWLSKCLNICKDYPVVVIDNASTDETVTYIKKQFPKVHLIPQSKNLGFGQANNLGIRYALNNGADYVFLLNQDAYLQGECINQLIKIHQNNPEFGILSPIHLNGKGDKLDENFSNYITYKHNADFYSDFVLEKPLSEVYEVPFVNAAGWLLPKKSLETVGGFDPIFFHYGEDNNYCQRITYHGFKIGVVPTSFLRHDREDRQVAAIDSPYNLQKQERKLKNIYSDVNKDNFQDLEHLIKKRKQTSIKLLLKLSFSKYKILLKDISQLENILKEVKISHEKNRIKGSHYLD